MFFPATAESRISVKSTDNCGLSTFVRRFRPIYVRCELTIIRGVVDRRAGGAGRVGEANISNMDSWKICVGYSISEEFLKCKFQSNLSDPNE